MNISEVLKIINIGDFYKSEKTLNDWREYKANSCETFNINEVLADDWEIKKKEEKLITAEEYYNKDSYKTYAEKKERIKAAFLAGENNNELKHKIEGKPVILKEWLRKNFEKLPHEVISDNTIEIIWDASAKNNDLKYKELIKLVEDFINNKDDLEHNFKYSFLNLSAKIK